jgi:hypothetical protein
VTRTDLLTAAARDLRILAGGGTLSGEQSVRLLEFYTSLHAMLLDKELVTWSLTEAIPEKCVVPVKGMLAALAVHWAGIGEPRRSELLRYGELDASPVSPSERMLRKALAPSYVEQPAHSEYF